MERELCVRAVTDIVDGRFGAGGWGVAGDAEAVGGGDRSDAGGDGSGECGVGAGDDSRECGRDGL